MRNYLFANIMFIIIYSSLFLFKIDIFVVLLFIYLLIINLYYWIRIEKLKMFLKTCEDRYNRQVLINDEIRRLKNEKQEN